MSSVHFPPVRSWIISKDAFAASMAEMAQDGRRGQEGIVLWLGRRLQGQARVTHLVELRGHGIIKAADYLSIDAWLINEITDFVVENEIALIGQIHSHGPNYGTDLSDSDRRLGIAVPYYLSIVAPDYGLRAQTAVTDCGVHVFEPHFGFRRLPTNEVEGRIHIAVGPSPAILILGEE